MAVYNVLLFSFFLGASISLDSDGSCYTQFNDESLTCPTKEIKGRALNLVDCCMNTEAEGYSNMPKSSAAEQTCQPCDKARRATQELQDKVFCFHTEYYEGESSCHEMEAKLQTPTQCCQSKSGHPNNKQGGFYEAKEVMNATVPTYRCKYCKREFGEASGWSEWSACSVSCEGGIKTRETICPRNFCFGIKKETKPCNEDIRDHVVEPTGEVSGWSEWGACSVSCEGGIRTREAICPRNCSFGSRKETKPCNEDIKCHVVEPTVIALICACILLTLLLLLILIKYIALRRTHLSSPHPCSSLDRSLKMTTPGMPRKISSDSAGTGVTTPRYHPNPSRRPPPTSDRLPLPVPSPNTLRQKIADLKPDDSEQHTYESLADDDSYYLEPMSRKHDYLEMK